MASVTFHADSHIIRHQHHHVQLTPREADIIRRGLRPNAIIRATPQIRATICRLRQRLQRHGIPPIIKTIPSGYITTRDIAIVIDGTHIITPSQTHLIKRLIAACPSPTLQALAQQQIFGDP